MDYNSQILISAKLLLATLLGGIIGFDREKHGANAGIRTYASVCLGSALFTAVAFHIQNDSSAASRIIANIITGVGFIGAGIIFRKTADGSTHGLTTAATI